MANQCVSRLKLLASLVPYGSCRLFSSFLEVCVFWHEGLLQLHTKTQMSMFLKFLKASLQLHICFSFMTFFSRIFHLVQAYILIYTHQVLKQKIIEFYRLMYCSFHLMRKPIWKTSRYCTTFIKNNMDYSSVWVLKAQNKLTFYVGIPFQ